MLYDIIFLAVLILFIIIGVKRKASKTIVGLMVIVFAGIAAIWLANLLSGAIYDGIVRKSIVNLVNDEINSQSSQNAEDLASAALSAIPAVVLTVLGYFGSDSADISGYLEKEAQFGSDYIAESVADLVKAPLAGIIALVLFIVLFIVLAILFNSLSHIVLKIFNLPVINLVDSILGGVFGFVEGILAVIIIALVLHLLAPAVSSDCYIFTEDYINRSFVMSSMFTGKLVDMIQMWIYDAGRLII